MNRQLLKLQETRQLPLKKSGKIIISDMPQKIFIMFGNK